MRKTRIIHIPLLLVMVMAACQCSAPRPEPPTPAAVATDNPLLSEMDRQVDDVARPYMRRSGHVGLMIAVSSRGERHFYGYGETRRGNGEIPRPTTIFEIGSITKTFTAALLCQELQARDIPLEQPIQPYLPPDIPPLQRDGEPIRFLHLLNHTSGLPELPDDFFSDSNHEDPYAHYTAGKIFEYLQGDPLRGKPGAAFQYSNLGVGLAGLLLERLSGREYERNLLDGICRPLGLERTRLDIPNERAAGHHDDGTPAPYYTHMGGFTAAGAIESSAHDMLMYGENQVDCRDAGLAATFGLTHQRTFSHGGISIGLAWFLSSYANHTAIEHNGGTHGFSSHLICIPEKQLVVLLLTNNYTQEAYSIAPSLAAALSR